MATWPEKRILPPRSLKTGDIICTCGSDTTSTLSGWKTSHRSAVAPRAASGGGTCVLGTSASCRHRTASAAPCQISYMASTNAACYKLQWSTQHGCSKTHHDVYWHAVCSTRCCWSSSMWKCALKAPCPGLHGKSALRVHMERETVSCLRHCNL